MITSKRKIKTTVMVDNNKILVLGGMIDNHAREKHNKVPLLGDIPILGHCTGFLFASDTIIWKKVIKVIFSHIS
jgi:general secretion pathway protein D